MSHSDKTSGIISLHHTLIHIDMKKLKLALILIAIFGAFSTSNAQSLKDLLQKAKGSSSSSSSGIENLIGGLGGLISTDKVDFNTLVGTWKYQDPAVNFKSDNLLKQAGGKAAAATIEAKLEPYYKTVGLNNLTLQIESDSTFVMTVKRIKLKGNITTVTDSNSDANFLFNFTIVGNKPFSSVDAYVSKAANGNIDLTFDVSGLIAIIERIGTLTNNKTASSVATLLKSYDGITAGYTLIPQTSGK